LPNGQFDMLTVLGSDYGTDLQLISDVNFSTAENVLNGTKSFVVSGTLGQLAPGDFLAVSSPPGIEFLRFEGAAPAVGGSQITVTVLYDAGLPAWFLPAGTSIVRTAIHSIGWVVGTDQIQIADETPFPAGSPASVTLPGLANAGNVHVTRLVNQAQPSLPASWAPLGQQSLHPKTSQNVYRAQWGQASLFAPASRATASDTSDATYMDVGL
jgi:hypothetical protein